MGNYQQSCDLLYMHSDNKIAYITQDNVRSFPVILMPFCTFPGQPRRSIIVLRQSRRYIADARNAYNYSRSALWGLGGGLAWLQSCHWFLMDVMPQSWCGLQGGQATIRKGKEGYTLKQVTEVWRERWQNLILNMTNTCNLLSVREVGWMLDSTARQTATIDLNLSKTEQQPS